MSNVSYVMSGTVADGPAFAKLATAAAAASTAGEPDALRYDWHVAEDGATFAIVGDYKNDAAFQHHVKHMTSEGLMDEFMKQVQVERVHVLTPVNDDTRGILGNFGATFMSKTASRG